MDLPLGPSRAATIEEIYGVLRGDLEAEPDTLRDKELACDLFMKLNLKELGIPNDSGLVIISDSEEDEPVPVQDKPVPRSVIRCYVFL